MARPRRVNCRKCNGHIGNVGKLSKRGLCYQCGVGAMLRNAEELHTKQGESLERWRDGVARSVGATLPPKPTPKETGNE